MQMKATFSIIALISFWPSRLSMSCERCEHGFHGGINSGRKVNTSSNLVMGICSMSNERNSNDEGSAQYKSS